MDYLNTMHTFTLYMFSEGARWVTNLSFHLAVSHRVGEWVHRDIGWNIDVNEQQVALAYYNGASPLSGVRFSYSMELSKHDDAMYIYMARNCAIMNIECTIIDGPPDSYTTYSRLQYYRPARHMGL